MNLKKSTMSGLLMSHREKYHVAFSNSWFKDGFAQTLCFNICGHENVGNETAVCAYRGTVVFY